MSSEEKVLEKVTKSPRRSKSPPPKKHREGESLEVEKPKKSPRSGKSPRPGSRSSKVLSEPTTLPGEEKHTGLVVEEKEKKERKKRSVGTKRGAKVSKSVAGRAVEGGKESRHKKIDSMSSSLVELLQMQVDRLEVELKRKTTEVEKAEKEALEARDEARQARDMAPVTTVAPSASLSGDGPLRVEIAQLKAAVKSMGESEGRHKARIQDLLKLLSEEREAKGEAIEQAEMKQSTIDLCSTEMDRLEEEKKDLMEQLEVKQSSIELLSTQCDSQESLIAATQERLTQVQATSDTQKANSKTSLEKANQEIQKLTEDLSALNVVLNMEREERKAKEEEMNKQYEDLTAAKEKSESHYKRELEKMESSVAAIASGRGRLEQLKELHEQMDAKQAAWEEEKSDMQDTIDSLTDDIEGLAESNAQLTTALESMEGDGNALVALSNQDASSTVTKLEEALAKALETEEESQKRHKELGQEHARVVDALAAAEEQCAELTIELNATKNDLKLAQESSASARKIGEAQRQQAKKDDERATQARKDLEEKLAEMTRERDDLRQTKAELERSLSVGERELANRNQTFRQELEELQGERASLKERLNDAIQERWQTEEALRKALEGGGATEGVGGVAAGGGKNALQAAEEKSVELEMKVRELSRKLQDSEGEAKRARMEQQKDKAKLGDMILSFKQKETENEKLISGLKLLSAQVIELEENQGDAEEMEADLAAAEELVEALENQVSELKKQMESPDDNRVEKLETEMAELKKELESKTMGEVAVAEDTEEKNAIIKELEEKAEVLENSLKEQMLKAMEVDELKERMAELEQSAGAGAGAGSSSEELEAKLKAVEEEKTAAVAKVAELEAAMAAAAAAEKPAAEETSSTTEEVDALKAKIEELEKESEAAKEAEAKLEVLEESLKEQMTKAMEVDELKEKIEELEKSAGSGGNSEELEAKLKTLEEEKAAVVAKVAELEAASAESSNSEELEAKLKAAEEEKAAAESKVSELEAAVAAAKEGGGEGEANADGGNTSERIAELESKNNELEQRATYFDQVEQELKTKKIQVLEMQENYVEVQKEMNVLKEKAENYDELEEKANSMEEFLMGLQDERNELAEKVETSEQQVQELVVLLGKAKAGGNADELKAALEKQAGEHTAEVESLKKQIAARDEQLLQVEETMRNLRQGMKKEDTSTPAPAAADEEKKEAEGEEVAAPAADAAAAAAGGADAGAGEEEENKYNLQVTRENLAADLVNLNTIRMEDAKERQSFADRKAFKDADAWAEKNNGRLIGVKKDDEVVGVCAVIKTPDGMEMKYIALLKSNMLPVSDAALAFLVREAEAFAREAGEETLIVLHAGAMADAEKKWVVPYGFKINGVGPAPDYAVRLIRPVQKK